MEPQVYHGDAAGAAGPGEMLGPPPLAMSRRKELIGLAEDIAKQVQDKTEPGRERCFLRNTVDMFVDR